MSAVYKLKSRGLERTLEERWIISSLPKMFPCCCEERFMMHVYWVVYYAICYAQHNALVTPLHSISHYIYSNDVNSKELFQEVLDCRLLIKDHQQKGVSLKFQTQGTFDIHHFIWWWFLRRSSRVRPRRSAVLRRISASRSYSQLHVCPALSTSLMRRAEVCMSP